MEEELIVSVIVLYSIFLAILLSRIIYKVIFEENGFLKNEKKKVNLILPILSVLFCCKSLECFFGK